MSSSDTSACVGSFKVVVHRDQGLDETLMMLDFSDLATFVEWTEGRNAVGEVLADMGDAAFEGPAGADCSFLCARSGSRAIRIARGAGGDTITTAQLEEVASLIIARMEDEPVE